MKWRRLEGVQQVSQIRCAEMRNDMKWNRKYAGIVAGVVAVALVGSGVGYQVITGTTAEDQTDKPQENTMGEAGDENTLVEEGTTQIQTESQEPAFTVNAVTMTVEEVYVESGTTVEEGDALFKITEESMADALAYYEEAVEEAEETLQTAELEFQSGVLEAEYELQSAQLTAENAQSNYDASASNLLIQVEEKKQEYEDTVEQILDYQNAINGGTYYLQAGIDEKQTAITIAEAAVTEAQNQLAAAQSTYDTAQSTIATDMESLRTQIAANVSYEELQVLADQVAADYTAVQTATTGLSQAQVAADTAQSTLEKANQSLESAVKEYNNNVETATERITELSERVEDLQEAYEQAERDATTAMTEVQKTYDDAVLAGKYAGTEYESALAELESTVESAQDALDDLKEEQEALLAMEDGVVCADRSGTLASVSYEAEDVLQKGVAFAIYYVTDTIYISVEVPQEDIAKLTVGDEVSVSITGNRGGAITGEISSIATSATTGGSISNVTYAVIISIDNTEGTLSSGSSATVTFDLSGEEE